MSDFGVNSPVTRRRALALGSGVAAAGALSGVLPGTSAGARRRNRSRMAQQGRLPVDQIEQIVQAQGTVTKNVLSIDIERKDIGDVAGPLGVTFTPAFEVDGTLTFQPLGGGNAFFNGDIALKPEETNPVIDAIIANGLIFQAFHQHYIETSPNIWFIHFRGHGDALMLARAVHNVLTVTSTPLPQTMPSNPTTPLDPDRLASILHGDAQVGDEGVVTVTIDRTDTILIDEIEVSPEANISTNVQFKPLSGSSAWVGPDFSMESSEVQPVVALMRQQGWFQGCLYNQETNEHPQLFFDHMLKRGDAYELARETRRGLDLTDAQ
ncbi:MAG TPA: DUF1259 domain-containing protein [Solirubrobacteraceae bacterium]|jgi:hypothetical protein|nr:DUF1259 domain-containing protein [Solirubrobacteraceae bacterium]